MLARSPEKIKEEERELKAVCVLVCQLSDEHSTIFMEAMRRRKEWRDLRVRGEDVPYTEQNLLTWTVQSMARFDVGKYPLVLPPEIACFYVEYVNPSGIVVDIAMPLDPCWECGYRHPGLRNYRQGRKPFFDTCVLCGGWVLPREKEHSMSFHQSRIGIKAPFWAKQGEAPGYRLDELDAMEPEQYLAEVIRKLTFPEPPYRPEVEEFDLQTWRREWLKGNRL